MPRYYRKVIRITGEDSPNVRYAFAEQAAGRQPSNRILVPGVLPYADYQKRMATWDAIRISIGIKAQFYKGRELLLFPPEWLIRAEAQELVRLCRSYPTEAIGIDPGEGVANTCFAAVNRYGLKDLKSIKTPDTSVIIGQTIGFMNYHNVPPEKVVMDRGGGGKQHADTLRRMGFNIRTVGFGETINLKPKRGMRMLEEKIEVSAERYAYKNRRAEMYGETSLFLDPTYSFMMGEDARRANRSHGDSVLAHPVVGFAIPPEYTELRRQLGVMPKWYDEEGRLYLPPKNRKPSEKKTSQSTKITLNEILGCSPDEADALVLGVHGLLHKEKPATAEILG